MRIIGNVELPRVIALLQILDEEHEHYGQKEHYIISSLAHALPSTSLEVKSDAIPENPEVKRVQMVSKQAKMRTATVGQ